MDEESKTTSTITKDMSLAEVTQKYPETMEVFFKYGLFCFGCPHASTETLEQGALGHEIELEGLLAELNQAVEKNSDPEKESTGADSEPAA